MTSLIEEYRKRHAIDCVSPVNEGVLFCSQDGQTNPIIVITSSFTKQMFVCPACAKNSDAICLEIFRRFSYPYCVHRITHTHMPPDADLLDYIHNHVPKGENYSPYISKGERDQERWLWEFFKMTGVFDKNIAWKSFKQQHKPERAETEWLEEVFWVLQHHGDAFRQFYEQVYSLCMINRHYILLG